MKNFVYILGSAGPRTYVGWTTDLERRIREHNSGRGARSTRGRKWILLYAERHATRRQAMRREWRLKRDRAFRKRLAAQPAAEPRSPEAHRPRLWIPIALRIATASFCDRLSSSTTRTQSDLKASYVIRIRAPMDSWVQDYWIFEWLATWPSRAKLFSSSASSSS
ncbi:MAG: GIY-YIG nuclease family protein [Rhodospirillales bacterium]|nr:GIY-YIG nuclease family protein [Rhodospirillales bacterium]